MQTLVCQRMEFNLDFELIESSEKNKETKRNGSDITELGMDGGGLLPKARSGSPQPQ